MFDITTFSKIVWKRIWQNMQYMHHELIHSRNQEFSFLQIFGDEGKPKQFMQKCNFLLLWICSKWQYQRKFNFNISCFAAGPNFASKRHFQKINSGNNSRKQWKRIAWRNLCASSFICDSISNPVWSSSLKWRIHISSYLKWGNKIKHGTGICML